ncbi:MAG TPA: hypothetical protein VMO26_25020 [Vicinamibacterales bacterium]|nr:hypothetical protein [Vicinamibacterales bacterium]
MALHLPELLPTKEQHRVELVDATVARANTIAISNTDSGWYDGDSGSHAPSNTSYFSGNDSFGNHYRNFFTFDLAAVAGETITSAQLQLFTYDISSFGTYTTYEVTTPVSTLTAGGSGQVTTYTDLGSGISFGSIGLSHGQSHSLILINLNAAAVAAIQANANIAAMFAIGGDFLGGDAFGFSNFDTRNQLILQTQTQSMPESTSTLELMLMVGLFGVFVKFSGLASA